LLCRKRHERVTDEWRRRATGREKWRLLIENEGRHRGNQSHPDDRESRREREPQQRLLEYILFSMYSNYKYT